MSVAPRATYRVQLRREFDFDAAAAIVPYLAALGVSHLYCSPYMEAARGSAHGYDVVDPARVSSELGGDAGLERLTAALRAHAMGQLLDTVPNHMCISDPRNRWWWDVLRHGRSSVYASFFDIDWDAPGLGGRVLLPVLGDTLDAVLARGELRVERGDDADGDVPELRYFEQRFPLVAAPPEHAGGVASRALLDEQHYVLEYWRTGLARVNYRRFFDIASLAAVRAEDPAVFAAMHTRALELVRDGVVDGLRIDHIDGLHDPGAYATTLRGRTFDAWLVAEKILAADEGLPRSWALDGTTGYDAAARLTGLHVDPRGHERLMPHYMEFTGDGRSFWQHARQGRVVALETLLSADLDRLARTARRAGIDDVTPELAELIAAMPVYRLYPREWEPLSPYDAHALDVALAAARAAGVARPAPLAAVEAVLRAAGEASPGRRELRVRFQQLSAAAMAKGVEDTAFYRHVPLVALNEVGGDPRHFGFPVARFHRECAEAADTWPLRLVATATHDTKRGEDARVRVAMLSEMPALWEEAVRRWHGLGRPYRSARAPSRTLEYLFFQTVVAAHPLSPDRCVMYMRKAAREAKQQTSWLSPDEAYESELEAFVRGMLDDAAFIEGVTRFIGGMTPAWHVAALSQTLLKLVVPGVADIYQGCELWDLSLVDPDNRRPVDYAERRALLSQVEDMDAAGAWQRAGEGLPKLLLLRRALDVRARHAAAFAPGSAYVALEAHGRRADHVVVCARASPQAVAEVLAVAVRLAYGLGGNWGATTLDVPAGRWRNALTGDAVDGGRVALGSLLHTFPVALLERPA